MAIFCAGCGAAMPDISSFCPRCGQSVKPVVAAATPGTSTLLKGPALAKAPSIAAPAALTVKTRLLTALAYLTFIPAIVFLLLEPYKRDLHLRFHAFQSIGFSAASVLLIGLVRLASIPLFLIRDWGLLFVGLLILTVSLAWGLLWMVLLIKAFESQSFRLPFIATLAEQWAGIPRKTTQADAH